MSKQTAVEWLDRWFRDNPEATHQEGNKALHQAKEMEKQQIIDAAERWKGTKFAEQYYNETYGSKGSDECHFEPTTNTSSATICKHCGREKFMHDENFKQFSLYEHKETITSADTPTSSQTEISDEKITKLANEHILYNNSKRQWIIEGMKLYKEQLKRGNNE